MVIKWCPQCVLGFLIQGQTTVTSSDWTSKWNTSDMFLDSADTTVRHTATPCTVEWPWSAALFCSAYTILKSVHAFGICYGVNNTFKFDRLGSSGPSLHDTTVCWLSLMIFWLTKKSRVWWFTWHHWRKILWHRQRKTFNTQADICII